MNKTMLKFVRLFVAMALCFYTWQVESSSLLLSKAELQKYSTYKPLTHLQLAELEDYFYNFYSKKALVDIELNKYFNLYDFHGKKIQTNSSSDRVQGISNANLGWGQFAYSFESDNNILLQVPHRFNDQFTLNIADHLWREKQVDFVYSNIIHRYHARTKRVKTNSDFSTAKNSALVAATKGWLAYKDNALVVQLHGFSQSKRKSKAAKNADIIVSHGTNLTGMNLFILTSIKRCLNQSLGVNVAVYPLDTKELGGTQNIIAKTIGDRANYQRFLHLEIARKTRIRLKSHSADSVALIGCVKKAYL